MKKIEELRDMQPEKILYGLGWIGIIVVILFYSIIRVTDISILSDLPPCYVYLRYGLYCPGCGGTRAVAAFLSGNILKSLCYHPFIPYFGFVFLIFMGTHTLEYLTRKKWRHPYYQSKNVSREKPKIRGMRYRNGYIYIGIAIILLQWIAKNIIWLQYGKHVI